MKIRKFLNESPVFALYQAQGSVIEHFQERLSSEGVHFVQALLLTAIFFEERGVRPTEMASAFGFSKSNLSHALRSLERSGLVLRSMHEKDARGYVFALSPSGRKKALNLIKIFDEVQDELEKKLGIRPIKETVRNISQIAVTYRDKFINGLR